MTIWTNRTPISHIWELAAENLDTTYSARDAQSDELTVSITELIQPPRITVLDRRYGNTTQCQQDVSDEGFFSAFLGTAAHAWLERMPDLPNVIKEMTLATMVTVNGRRVRVIGHPDRMEIRERGIYLMDLKFPKAWSVRYGLKQEWRNQIHGYQWLIHQVLGLPVEYATIEYGCRDWDRHSAAQNKQYPQQPQDTVEVELATIEEAENFVFARLQLLISCLDMESDEQPFCTDDERWATRDVFKVCKLNKDGSRPKVPRSLPGASKFETRTEAEAWRVDWEAKHERDKGANKAFTLFSRGESKRCELYCALRNVCNQYAAMKRSEKEPIDPTEIF